VSSAGLGNLGSWSRSRLTTRSCSKYGRGRDWFGPHTTALALVLLPVVFLLGLAAYARLVQINTEEFQLVLAMNRLRQAYARIEPGVVPFLTTGRTDDERGLVATYMLGDVGRTWLWIHFIVNTPTIVGTVVAAIAAVVTVLLLQAGERAGRDGCHRRRSGVRADLAEPVSAATARRQAAP
jgi:hypothetical protein